uniref:NADH dehydrogenase subunit 6 n=1 Tax=Brachypelma albiceps TaxID=1750704 RepID=UPI001FF4621D|nr:NADH dehydrogenase subunit 6 [Brachypelma albiceps]UIO59252.1 NADH dehydrogenase subunit 6 [Brachypelma albiceps]
MWLKIMILMSVMFVMSSQPMSLIMMMVVMVFFYSLYMYMGSGTFWYSIVLLLVMLSGVMVVFSYMASMSPNNKFELWYSGVVMMMLVSYEFWGWWQVDYTFFSMELWNLVVMVVNEFMVIFLLVIMLMVVWLSGWWNGPVRV